MRTGFIRQISYLLALMLVLLPFTSVHSFSGHNVAGTEMNMHINAGMDHCQHTADHLCADHHGQTVLDENCCSDHCEASCGVQLCLANELIFGFVNTHLYSVYKAPPIPNPVLSGILRPPLAIS